MTRLGEMDRLPPCHLWCGFYLFTFGPGKPVPSDPVSPGRPGGPGSPYGNVKRLNDERFGVMNEAVLNVS